jgi:hypothetical protein
MAFVYCIVMTSDTFCNFTSIAIVKQSSVMVSVFPSKFDSTLSVLLDEIIRGIYEILHTLNLGCSFITIREPCNNQRLRCDIEWLHVANHLYHVHVMLMCYSMRTDNVESNLLGNTETITDDCLTITMLVKLQNVSEVITIQYTKAMHWVRLF